MFCLSSGWGVCGRRGGGLVTDDGSGAGVGAGALVGAVAALRGVGVHGGALVGHVSNKTALMIGVIGNSLDSAVGQGNLNWKEYYIPRDEMT